MRRGQIVRITEGRHAGEIGLLVEIHDSSIRRRRYDVALDGYDSRRCFAKAEMEPYDYDRAVDE